MKVNNRLRVTSIITYRSIIEESFSYFSFHLRRDVGHIVLYHNKTSSFHFSENATCISNAW